MIQDDLDFIQSSPQQNIPQGVSVPVQNIPPPQPTFTAPQATVHHTVGEYASIWHGGFPGEPSLFEELGIHNSDVKSNLIYILSPNKVPRAIDNNFLISILFFIAYAFLLLLTGMPRFGTVYMIAVIGSIVLYSAFHYMSLAFVPDSEFTVMTLVTAISYCLPPIVPALFISRIFKLRIITAAIISIPCVGWASYCAARYLLPILKLQTLELVIIPLYIFFSYMLLLPLM
ncbi:Golgi membrane protein, putative [Trichomonas vaginalis G3]|uniref:Golgi membrane protein, putative n=1 Tax=Trichomonas vaginalis (strain ATCC PRA-98 / G3) TaxID=412133 RepID=A2F8W6_TRIV3|nr:vesicle-mediated transport [Trichomonas vaginalis G3]EAX98648.1 Golgi membrane protein, putative [Trichomonas vaginalis G3]KAI5508438.1 vesicle-mediated transport [Trichomonas vaginalis G3]|eukprot:XP_001311578.1 Golgi membrane protein [Trichomonas vaginalis G3]